MANEETVILRAFDDWAGFVLFEANGQKEYLKCHDWGDIEREKGGLTLTFCPDPSRAGGRIITGAFQAEDSPVSVEINTSIRKTKDVLTKLERCPGYLFLQDTCGRRDVFSDYDSQWIVLYVATVTGNTWTNVGKKSPADNEESMQTFAFEGTMVKNPFKPLANSRLTIAETAALNFIDICSTDKCPGVCGQSIDICQNIFVGGDAGASGSPAAAAIPWDSTDSGATFIEESASPFAASEAIAAGICIPLGNDTFRRIVFRGTTDAGNPAESAYSDDGGVTWTNVNIGSVNGQYVETGKAVAYTPEGDNIWVATTGGYIYKSTDKGLTWTAVHAAELTSNDFHAIRRYGRNFLVAVGENDTIIRSQDGGTSWAALTATGSGVTLNIVFPVNKNRFFVGAADGNLYFTEDGATTWSTRSFTGSGSGSVNDVAFLGELDGYMLHNTAAPVGTIYHTRDGGASWDALTTATNEGLNMLHICSPDEALAVGEPVTGGTAVIVKIAPTTDF